MIRCVGRGSFGEVWLCRDIVGVFRAIKIIGRDQGEGPKPSEREFAGLAAFSKVTVGSNHQLNILHIGKDDARGLLYYVMELADDCETGRFVDPERYKARTLYAVLVQSRRLPPKELVEIAIPMVQAVAELHARNLVHRDIKPSNILFVCGVPKLADIGLVSISDESGTIVGTEGYLPPEGPGTAQADIYSLGKVLYEMLTGEDRRKFPVLPTDLLEQKKRAEILELNEVVIRACAPQADKRYASANALLADLKMLQQGKSLRRRQTLRRGFIAFAAAAAATAVFVMVRDRFAHGGAGDSEVQRLLARAETLLSGNLSRSGIDTADELARRASEVSPDSARAWALRSYAAACRLLRGWDRSSQQAFAVQEYARRALEIDEAEPTALLSLAIMYSAQGAHGQAEQLARQGIAARDTEPRLWRVLFRAIYDQGRQSEALTLADSVAVKFSKDVFVHYDRAVLYWRAERFVEAEGAIDTSLQVERFTVALIAKAFFCIEQRGDVGGARAVYDQIPRADRTEDRVITTGMTLALLERKPVQVLEISAHSANSYFNDFGAYGGPKAFWEALAYRIQGKGSLEREAWQNGIAVLKRRILAGSHIWTDPARVAIGLAWLGNEAEAMAEIREFEAKNTEAPSIAGMATLSIFYAAMGSAEISMRYLQPTLDKWGGFALHFVRLHPWWDKVRGQPPFAEALGLRASHARVPVK